MRRMIERRNFLSVEAQELLMRHGNNECVHVLDIVHRLERNPVKPLRLRSVRRRVNHHGDNSVLPKLPVNIDHLRVSRIRAVLLEGKAQNRHFSVFDGNIRLNQRFHQALRHIFAHVVIDPPAGEDDLGVIPELLRLVGQIIRVYADTVAAHKSRHKGQEIPFRARRFQHGFGVTNLLLSHRQCYLMPAIMV